MTSAAAPPSPVHGIAVRLAALSKRFGAVSAVDRCTLQIPAGSFVTILGPSGSGKTTLLNLIAGFLRPDEGEVFFSGAPMSAVPSHKRGIGMVFQGFALFPHMSVFDNVAFPLRMRDKISAGALIARVESALEVARLGGLAARRPSQLSGGQKQRVAMARALVSRPPLLLLDEPLSALDKSLREELQVKIKSLHRKVGSTFICVTHDQQEALAMSDLVVVMREGRIEQVADPQTLYRRPDTAFVARFLGGANILPARLESREAPAAVQMGAGERIFLPVTVAASIDSVIQIVFRPEVATLGRLDAHQASDARVNRLRVRVTETVFLGESLKVMLEREGQELLVKLPIAAATQIRPDDQMSLSWPVQETLVMAAESAEDRR